MNSPSPRDAGSSAPPAGSDDMTAAARIRATVRVLGLLLVGFLAALIVVAGATRWLPEGRAHVDHIVLPIVFFPLVWAGLSICLYALPNRRTWAWVAAITALHLGFILHGFVG